MSALDSDDEAPGGLATTAEKSGMRPSVILRNLEKSRELANRLKRDGGFSTETVDELTKEGEEDVEEQKKRIDRAKKGDLASKEVKLTTETDESLEVLRKRAHERRKRPEQDWSVEEWVDNGVYAYKKGDLRESIRSYEMCADLDAGNYGKYFRHCAVILAEVKIYHLALECYERATEAKDAKASYFVEMMQLLNQMLRQEEDKKKKKAIEKSIQGVDKRFKKFLKS